MITIFNGRKRTLGEGGQESVFAQVSVDFRNYLHTFKGAKLHVFFAIALHANERGWAWPSYGLLSKETGYSEATIRRALAALCEVKVQGHRVLLRYQPQTDNGTFASNRYLLFPSAEEAKEYEGSGVKHLGASTKGGFDDRGGKTPPRVNRGDKIPQRQNTATVKPHHKEEPPSKQKPASKEEPEAAASSILCSIHNEPMQPRSKDGDRWYSHRLPDGTWCKGAPGDQPPDVEDSETDRRRYLEWAQQ